jgi:hypothetical protein
LFFLLFFLTGRLEFGTANKVYTNDILKFTCMVKPNRNRNKEKKRKVENVIKFT